MTRSAVYRPETFRLIGAIAVNRTEFQQLADVRIEEAKKLLAAGAFDGAYYLAGYAVECALKACIAKLTNQYDYPDKRFAADCYTHDIEVLVRLAGVKIARDADTAANAQLGTNWLIVRDWNESSRYQRCTQLQAQKLYDAITDNANGVLPWIKARW
jgi:HEPN domain-containing protein